MNIIKESPTENHMSNLKRKILITTCLATYLKRDYLANLPRFVEY